MGLSRGSVLIVVEEHKETVSYNGFVGLSVRTHKETWVANKGISLFADPVLRLGGAD